LFCPWKFSLVRNPHPISAFPFQLSALHPPLRAPVCDKSYRNFFMSFMPFMVKRILLKYVQMTDRPLFRPLFTVPPRAINRIVSSRQSSQSRPSCLVLNPRPHPISAFSFQLCIPSSVPLCAINRIATSSCPSCPSW
jgi:hypothetical protein